MPPPRLQLVAVEGPLQGDTIELTADGKVLLGRSKRGVHLPDPQVSLEHAEIVASRDRFQISDLGSVSGTFVNDKRLGRDPVALSAGNVIRIGETVLRVQEIKQSRMWILPVVIGAGIVLGVVGWAGKQLAAPVTFAPMLHWSEPVHLGDGTAPTSFPIPIAFVRATGLDETSMSIRRVTDFDANGIDELWLTTATSELLVTFDDDGWLLVAELPFGCLDRPGGEFPDLQCDDDLWMYSASRGTYVLSGLDGIVVWVDRVPVPGPDGVVPPRAAGPLAFRVGVDRQRQITGFLAARGVEEPVHYIICEEAIPGIAAQALTESGRIETLDYGCIREIKVNGSGDLAGEFPLMLAFTAHGRQALIDDLREYLSGEPEGLFLDPMARARIDAIASPPVQRRTMRTMFVGADLPSEPFAREQPIGGRRSLVAGFGGRAAPRAEIVTVTESPMRIDPPGCSEIEVVVHEWYCVLTKLCTPSQTAVEVNEVGCGGPSNIAAVPFTGGIVGGANANVEIRAAVDSHGGSGRVDVLRVRVGWREVAK